LNKKPTPNKPGLDADPNGPFEGLFSTDIGPLEPGKYRITFYMTEKAIGSAAGFKASPKPSTLTLAGIGLLAWVGLAWRRAKAWI
jgi:hypothetical protein